MYHWRGFVHAKGLAEESGVSMHIAIIIAYDCCCWPLAGYHVSRAGTRGCWWGRRGSPHRSPATTYIFLCLSSHISSWCSKKPFEQSQIMYAMWSPIVTLRSLGIGMPWRSCLRPSCNPFGIDTRHGTIILRVSRCKQRRYIVRRRACRRVSQTVSQSVQRMTHL